MSNIFLGKLEKFSEHFQRMGETQAESMVMSSHRQHTFGTTKTTYSGMSPKGKEERSETPNSVSHI